MPEVKLALAQGTEKEGRILTLRGTRVLIGRTERCSIRLGVGVSAGEHAALIFDTGVWSVRDLGGADGVFVNGRRVSTATIEAGDLLGIGPDGAQIQILEVDPPSESSHAVPVLDPVWSPPPPTLATPVRRGVAWPGLVLLLAVLGGLCWVSGLGGGPRPVTRAESPRELFFEYRAAARDRHYVVLYDLAGPEYRKVLAKMSDATPGPEFRDSLTRRKPEGWVETVVDIERSDYVRADLAADGQSGFLVLRDPEGRERRVKVIFEEGGWRVVFGQYREIPR